MTQKALLAYWMIALCIALMATPVSAEPDTIYIAEGGYYVSGPFPTYWTAGEMWVNMTIVGNGSVDVYIMTTTQYFNSYSPYSDNASAPLAVSFLNSSVENTGSASIHFQWNNSDVSYETTYSDIYVVIDNRNCTLTSGDANPSGPVTVSLDVDIIGDYSDYSDISMEGIGLILLMVIAGPLILIVIVVVVIVVATKKSNTVQPPYYYPMMPPQPPQPPATGK